MIPDLNDIQETFSLLTDWEDRYAYLIDLGRQLPEFPENAKTEEFLVKGCTSQVWMILTVDNDGIVSIKADSDAHIVKGLIALVIAVYNNQNTKDISSIDMNGIFNSLGLSDHLSPNRRNGFFAMVQRIKSVGG